MRRVLLLVDLLLSLRFRRKRAILASCGVFFLPLLSLGLLFRSQPVGPVDA